MILRNYLRRKEQLEIAEMQDIVLSIVIRLFDSPPILHGGTVIWRVYKSPRFSEDLDFYIGIQRKNFEKKFKKELEHFSLKLLKFRETKNAIYCEVLGSRRLRVEFLKKSWGFNEIEAEYELVNGGFILIKTLDICDLLKEKILAFRDRKKSRDLFDIYFLLSILDKECDVSEINYLIPLLKTPPKDWHELRVLIIKGLPPSFENVRRKIIRMIQ